MCWLDQSARSSRWRGTFSAFECAVKGCRQREDPWNDVISGFMTGGSLALRGGPREAFASAVACGFLVGVFKGVVSVLFDRGFNKGPRPMA
ncbi:hypothetical protein CPB85DRAFT_1220045 [Mucidula mucida]|nr:hypothetical protein CPB85DRAFT_1220045 [Mucidula mucida]